jgi:hypothetical protein
MHQAAATQGCHAVWCGVVGAVGTVFTVVDGVVCIPPSSEYCGCCGGITHTKIFLIFQIKLLTCIINYYPHQI